MKILCSDTLSCAEKIARLAKLLDEKTVGRARDREGLAQVRGSARNLETGREEASERKPVASPRRTEEDVP